MRAVNAAGLRLIKAFEGFSATPYRCPGGWWTIGYGATRGPDGGPVSAASAPLDEAAATALLQRDVAAAAAAVTRLLPVALTDNQFAALASFTFNVGAGALQRSTLRQAVLRGGHGEVPAQLLRWVRAGGRVLAGLVRRRQAEAALYAA